MNELDLFVAAVGTKNGAERATLLDRECVGLPELRQRLELLLEAYAKPPTVFNTNSTTKTEVYESSDMLKGYVIAGRYKLLENIGEGGMGSVWLAEQTAPVKRKVALKLIKAGMDSE